MPKSPSCVWSKAARAATQAKLGCAAWPFHAAWQPALDVSVKWPDGKLVMLREMNTFEFGAWGAARQGKAISKYYMLVETVSYRQGEERAHPAPQPQRLLLQFPYLRIENLTAIRPPCRTFVFAVASKNIPQIR